MKPAVDFMGWIIMSLLIENHRIGKTRCGVWMFVRDSISFLKRPGLEIFNEYIESIFIEI